MQRIVDEQPELVAETLALVAGKGPIRAGQTGFERPDPRPGHMWNWHDGKVALEHLFYTRTGDGGAPDQLRAALRPAGARPSAEAA